jgi:DNA-binding Lrp family transcriptional regulator
VRVVAVFVFLAVSTESGFEDEVHRLLKRFSEVTESHRVLDGPYDIVAMVSVDEFDGYREFAVDKVGSLPHVEDYTSFITMAE